MIELTQSVPSDPIRIGKNRIPIYLIPDAPFWFVPTPSAHKVLSQCHGSLQEDSLAVPWNNACGKGLFRSVLDIRKFLSSITLPSVPAYTGRTSRPLMGLKEIWFHITDKCNLRCKHCLFGHTLSAHRAMPQDAVLHTIKEGRSLRCRLVCFTGGEPFSYPGFVEILNKILSFDDLVVAILTNGLLVPSQIPKLNNLDTERIHLQVTLDGPEHLHDEIRGKGTYRKTADAIQIIKGSSIPCRIATAINERNVGEIEHIVRIAAQLGISNIHFQWHFKRGYGSKLDVPQMEKLIPSLISACELGSRLGVSIDNVDAIASQVFSPPGTRYDLGNACWESLAVGPEGAIYPTPAMVDRPECVAGYLHQGLERVWKNSSLFREIRGLSLIDCVEMKSDPWHFMIGGGDIDHCLQIGPQAEIHLHPDPYGPVYRSIAMHLIEKEAKGLPVSDKPGIILRMGDVTTNCPSGDEVNFLHCNCLLSISQGNTQGLVREFYSEKAVKADKKILNPIQLPTDADFIPSEAKVRMYGCGSPAQEAQLRPGETVLDLGSGSGVECFLASKAVGPDGLVLGLDMTQEMLDIAERSSHKIAKALGYRNVKFLKGYLEHIPLGECTADVVISNCVINLSKNKRKVFSEIFRVLKPGGRLIISDVVTEEEPPPKIRADHQLIGECLGGAMVERYLFSLLEDMGFEGTRVLKRFPYREVSGHSFYSLTFLAHKPSREQLRSDRLTLYYPGPFQAILLNDSNPLLKAHKEKTALPPDVGVDQLTQSGIFILDEQTGMISNTEMEPTCSCFDASQKPQAPKKSAETIRTHDTGCLICGEPIVYLNLPEQRSCALCGSKTSANAVCTNGHFVCDICHIKDPLEVIKKVCTTSTQTDLIVLLKSIRSHKSLPIHGPEDHAMVPGIILAAYRNSGGDIPEDSITTGIERGALIPGGACGFMGSCGAAIGVGIAFSLILEASPLTPRPRKQVQTLVSNILQKIGKLKAARCCQRESYLSLVEAAKASQQLLPIPLKAREELTCNQYMLNKECIKRACILYPKQASQSSDTPFPIVGKKL